VDQEESKYAGRVTDKKEQDKWGGEDIEEITF
jgi:hypothetical protein